MVERSCLLSSWPGQLGPRVRIPVSPPKFALNANAGKFWQRIENRDLRFDCKRFSIRSIFDYRFSKIMAFIFEKLDVYRKAVDFADKICELTKDFAKGNYYLADQLNRTSLSISSNIAEGNGRYHKADRTNFFRIARGSAFECVPILELCKRKKLIDDSQNETLKKEIENICKMLSGLMNC